jgi:hypothetical protein
MQSTQESNDVSDPVFTKRLAREDETSVVLSTILTAAANRDETRVSTLAANSCPTLVRRERRSWAFFLNVTSMVKIDTPPPAPGKILYSYLRT